MGEYYLKGLQGMKGLAGLTSQDRRKWEIANAEKIRGKSLDAMEKLYRNQQYATKYGIDSFYSHTPEQRNNILKEGFLNEEIEKRYSPITGKDKYGHSIVNPNKGVGNLETYNKILSMNPSSKERLIDSGWLTSPQVNKLKDKYSSLTRTMGLIMSPISTLLGINPAKEIEDNVTNGLIDSKNNNIFESIYANDLKQKEKSLQPYIDKQYNDILNNWSDTEVKNTFNQIITPVEGKNLGNGQLAAFKDTHIMKNFSIDDMRRYIAKNNVLNAAFKDNPQFAYDALNNYAKEYINDHQNFGDEIAALGKDIYVTGATYTADKVNGVRQLYNLAVDKLAGDVQVYQDNKGNVISKDKVRTARNGSTYYINDEGNAISVKKVNRSRYSLDMEGKDSEGNERDLFFNNRLLSKAEQYGVLNREEIEKYDKLGASPYKLVYKPGEDSSMLYESLKMSGFAAADMLSTAIPVYGQSVGIGLKAVNTASKLGKLANVTGKALYGTSKVIQGVQPTVAAAAIGNAYGRNAYAEMFTENMQKLEESTYENAKKEFTDSYTNDKKFKSSVNNAVNNIYKQLKAAQANEIKKSEGTKKIVDEEANNKMLMSQAKELVFKEYVDNRASEEQNSNNYIDKVGKASEFAGSAAATLAITDGAKYFLVNNWGFRNYLFKTPSQSAAKAAAKAAKLEGKVVETERRLSKVNGAVDRFANRFSEKTVNRIKKAATFGKVGAKQIWGGAWTNFTDEMQTWGSKEINQDKFSKYINGEYDPDSANIFSKAINNTGLYYKGAMQSLGKWSTWQAGIVGGLGSVISVMPNVGSIAQTFSTKLSREAFKKAPLSEKINMLVSNGILNEYYSKQASEREINDAVNTVNRILDNYDDFSVLRNGLALDRASLDATNEVDRDVLDYLKAVHAIGVLNQFKDDASVQDQHKSRMKRLLESLVGDSAEPSALAEAVNKSSVLTKALSELKDITEGNLNEENLKDYLTEYYAKNPNIAQSPENNMIAMEQIQQNAQKLLEAHEKVEEINKKLDQVEEDRDEKLSSTVRYNLVSRAALDGILDEKTKDLEKKITGYESTSYSNPVESYGTEEAIQQQIKALEKSERKVNEELEKARKESDDADEALQEFKDSHNLKKLTEEEIKDYSRLQQEADNRYLAYEHIQSILDKINSQQKEFTLFDRDSKRVFTKEEILSMHPETRARMLDKDNLKNYSKEQQKIINELITELTLKDPSILQAIQDQARLVKEKEANASAFEAILDNPEAAAVEFNAMDDYSNRVANNLNKIQVVNSVKKFIDQVNELAPEGTSKEEIEKIIFQNLSKLKPETLEFLDSLDFEDSNYDYGMLPTFKSEITKAKEYSKTLLDISKTIDNMKLEEAEEKVFRGNVDSLIKEATSRDEVINIFQDIVNSEDVSEADKSKYTNLLNALRGVEEQRNSTTIESKKEKETREENQQSQRKQEKKKIEEVEKKVDTSKSKETIITNDEEKKQEEELEKYKDKDIEGKEIDLGLEEDKNKSSILKKSEESKTSNLESPTLEEQLDEAKKESESNENVDVRNITPDTTSQGNNMTTTSSNLLGNTMYRYDIKSLEEDGKEVKRTGRNSNDIMSQFFNWFENEKIDLQGIIDNELSDILKVNNKVEVIYINPQRNATNDAALENFPLLVVEYNDKVKKIHNEDRGGVITANGSQYLIVGTLGYSFKNTLQKETFIQLLTKGKSLRDIYFNANTSERFFVDRNLSTEVEQMTSGRIVRETVNDNETQIRSVIELLSDPNRNPKGLKLEDLKWGIQYDDKFATVGVSSRNTVYPPRDALSNSGAVFLLIEAANGNYIPAAIMTTMLSDITDGKLKTQFNNLFNELTSTNYADRKKAISQLVQMLYLSKDGNNILIGKEGTNTISTVKNGVILRTFNLDDTNFNRMDLINAIYELNPRINITLSTLKDSTLLKIYAEAGALNTDIAKIGTSNASYTVYTIGDNGKPIKTEPLKNTPPSTETNSDLEKADYKKNHSVYYKGTLYREKNGDWYTQDWKKVTDPTIIQQLKWKNHIRKNELTPDLISNDKYGNKNVKYYIINSNNKDAKVLKEFENGNIAELNTNDSIKIIELVHEKELQRTREEAAKKEREKYESNQEALKSGNVEIDESQEIPLFELKTTKNTEITLTEKQLEEQSKGNFTSEENKEITDGEERAKEIVSRIMLDTQTITLDEEKSVYIDSLGNELARVTNVIQATEGAERFDPNSPFKTPSTNIGIGFDDFVRDFFAGTLDNINDADGLQGIYPNATNSQLHDFLNQLKELRKFFNEKGLTVVPRDITVTGEVEVTDGNGKKYKLPVAGTLDLLAYDKQGNFYIFDMKTNRGPVTEAKKAKWNKQLSLYKQFLEQKYGVKVVETGIIPIKVSYPTPKGFKNGTTVYRTARRKNQLWTHEEYENGSSTGESMFLDSKPTLLPNIPITTSSVKVEYSLLTDSEKSLLLPIPDGKSNSYTGVKNSESKNKNDDINETGNKSLAELQSKSNTNPTDVNSILKDRRYSKRVRGIMQEKGFKGKSRSEAEAWLKEHNMPISNIDDIDSWIDMLQNCR